MSGAWGRNISDFRTVDYETFFDPGFCQDMWSAMVMKLPPNTEKIGLQQFMVNLQPLILNPKTQNLNPEP